MRKGLESGLRPPWTTILGKQGKNDECQVVRDKVSPPPIQVAVEEKEI